MIVKPIKPGLIRLDGGTQSRAEINPETVAEYVASIQRGDRLPPPVLFYDGSIYWCADGFHRIEAHKQAHPGEPIECEIKQGDRDAAVWHSCGANKDHGLPRTRDDKRRAVEAALRCPKSSGLSDRAIAAHVGVDPATVGRTRADLGLLKCNKPEERTGQDGHKRGVHSDQRSKAGKASAAKRAAEKQARADTDIDEGGDADEAPIPECAPPIDPPKPAKPQPPIKAPATRYEVAVAAVRAALQPLPPDQRRQLLRNELDIIDGRLVA